MNFHLCCRSEAATVSNAHLLDVLDKLDAILRAFVGCQDVDGVHNACRLVWNASLPLLDQKLSKQVKKSMTSAAQALASVASPLHSLRLAMLLASQEHEEGSKKLVMLQPQIDHAASEEKQQKSVHASASGKPVASKGKNKDVHASASGKPCCIERKMKTKLFMLQPQVCHEYQKKNKKFITCFSLW